MAQERWYLQEARQSGLRMCREFAESLGNLASERPYIKGNILVIGPAGLMPERILFTKLHGGIFPYSQLRPEITSVTVCEQNPRITGFSPVLETADVPIALGQAPDFKPDRINLCTAPAKAFLANLPPGIQFDSILFFRVPNLEYVLHDDGLMQLIEARVAPQGYFIGSGGFKTGLQVPSSFTQVDIIPQLPPDPGYIYYGNNTGFVLRKG